MSIVELPAHSLSCAIHAREISCRDVMQAYLRRIDVVNPRHQAIVSLQDGDLLLRQADERDAQLARGESMGWMHGMPQAIKDLCNTAGIPTTLGSPLMRNFVPQEDGLMVQRMKAAGCIVIGKTNTSEFGLGSHTFNEVFGVTRNAYDISRSAGGSSGGAAVALALRMLPVADGSDFMGSLRNPAGWNNVFGLRPSQGRVPMWPAQDAWVSQLGTEGPMGRTVQDVARLLDVQAGFDQRAPLSIADGARFTGALGGFDCKGVRIGWLGDLSGHLNMEPGILGVCEQGLHRLEVLGCAVEPAQLGMPPERIWRAWLVWRRALVAARIAPFLLNPKNRSLIKAEALWEHEEARNLSGTEFLSASVQRTAFYQHMLSLFKEHDFLALPVAQVWPFDVDQRWPGYINGVEMDTYHRWMEVTIYATFAGLPCISVPVGFDARGLPMGLQLIGKPHGDWELLQLAYAYEQTAQEVLQRPPPVASAWR
ncbi:amidase [Rhodoferax sp.]|uniref:amidase n=1 Tax=Rhodoferax sp. TaxID=50421 RepID=UPI002720A4CC|nr:amidase [Rhodoferax sp.]MDO9195059.1 amidase [Rhodoferax sp.]